ncbi:hypothetical protein MNV49_000318 [Pseudohyphozyma bogoriensis]|nr:hypothetical protein MNV49_000318 [Pseudohyphozyma bogoriensis]
MEGQEHVGITLHDLPAELLYAIHLSSLSSSLPYVSSHLYGLFSSTTPTYKARYLLLRHPSSTLSHAIKYPICDRPVLTALERIAGKGLKCKELPRRLVRRLSANDADADEHDRLTADLDLIEYLVDKYSASANSRKGYFLVRAVFARNEFLINLLLKHGADPGTKDGMAVVVAIEAGDLDLVKKLMEIPVERDDADGEVELDKGGKKRRMSGGGGGGKRRKLESTLRCEPTPAMLEVAVKKSHWHLVEYLRGLGAVPSMEALQFL